MKIFSAQLKGTTIVVSGSTASITGSFTGSIAGIDINATNAFTASTIARLNSIETISSSNDSRVNSLEAFSSSIFTTNTFTSSTSARLNALETTSASVLTLNSTQNDRLNALETTSASVDILNTAQNSRLSSLELRTGSLASTGSNTFIGTQTITGSLFISANLVVQGTSSLENITASAVSIGTNIVNLNTANPAIRYAGLVIGDSGSIGSSGSFFYDSVQDEFIFVHRGANTTVTSSVVLMGPQTYDNIGNETYLTSNRIPKGAGNEHLTDSNISDTGTLVTVNSITQINGSLSGSSAGFSGNLRIGQAAAATNVELNINGVANKAGRIQFQESGTNSWLIGNGAASENGNFEIYNANGQQALVFTKATSAATFASSVSAASLGIGNNTSGFGDVVLISNTNSNVYPRVNRSSTSYEAGWKLSTAGTDNWYLGLRSTDGVGSYHFYSYTTNSSVISITNSGNLLIGTVNGDVGGSVPGTIIRQNGTMAAAMNMSSPINYQAPFTADRMNTAGDGLMYGMWRAGIFQAGIGATSGQAMTFFNGDGSNSSQPIRMSLTKDGYLHLPQSRYYGDSDIAYMDLYNPNTGNIRIVNTSANTSFGNIVFSTVNTERMRITTTGNVFSTHYNGGNLMGGYSVIGTISPGNTGDRYLHVRFNTTGSMMYWIKVLGYTYIYGLIEGLSGGYIGGGTGGVNQAHQNGSIVAQYQNNGFLEIVVDAINGATTNRWGSMTFFGGTDNITTVQPLEITAHSWTSTTTRVY